MAEALEIEFIGPIPRKMLQADDNARGCALMPAVEARFAGGLIVITVELFDVTGTKMISFRAPSSEFPLFPNEARALALRLIAAAKEAERAG
ncbi:hypothetical protein [Cryobacterium sp. TMT2-42-4]|uniref:hypothetical protein n=1 Tax=Cryobacterium sp. TMT2-42-4 TaxID=1259255 RepID=UPI0010692594|nr:hypothetical protein [Cryobacterium sp. TMT2-42-4]TFC37669.1 hypothetical protein E3O18_05045 [Cryobacterium sp. TMT2-42-4]